VGDEARAERKLSLHGPVDREVPGAVAHLELPGVDLGDVESPTASTMLGSWPAACTPNK
jgi:hypothetical protein